MPAAVGTGEAAASPPPRGADPASTQGPRTFAAFGLVGDCGGPDLGRTQAGRGGKCAGGQCETTRRAAPTPRRLLPASTPPSPRRRTGVGVPVHTALSSGFTSGRVWAAFKLQRQALLREPSSGGFQCVPRRHPGWGPSCLPRRSHDAESLCRPGGEGLLTAPFTGPASEARTLTPPGRQMRRQSAGRTRCTWWGGRGRGRRRVASAESSPPWVRDWGIPGQEEGRKGLPTCWAAATGRGLRQAGNLTLWWPRPQRHEAAATFW